MFTSVWVFFFPIYVGLCGFQQFVKNLNFVSDLRINPTLNSNLMTLVDTWSKVYHPNIVQLREAFTTKAFGDSCKLGIVSLSLSLSLSLSVFVSLFSWSVSLCHCLPLFHLSFSLSLSLCLPVFHLSGRKRRRIKTNEQEDRLANTAVITAGPQFGRTKVHRGMKDCQSMDRPVHHSIDHLKERRVEKGSSQHCILWVQEWSVFIRKNINVVSRVVLGSLLTDALLVA